MFDNTEAKHSNYPCRMKPGRHITVMFKLWIFRFLSPKKEKNRQNLRSYSIEMVILYGVAENFSSSISLFINFQVISL